MKLSNSPHLPVVIPSYENPDALCRCLESLNSARGLHLEPIVVDDHSRDDTVQELRSRFPGCELLVNERNLGFAATCNVGFRRAFARGAEFVLLLNQDTIITPELPSHLLEFMRAHESAAVVGPKTYSLDDTDDSQRRVLYAGSWRGLLPLQQRVPGIERADTELSAEPVQTDYVWGHGMMLRCAALRKTGGFDEEFPMYFEDLDLCLRLRARGFEIWCDPRATMWHDQPDGARAMHSEYWRWAYKVRSMTVFHRKHYGRLASRLLTPLNCLAEGRHLLAKGRVRAIGHLARAGVAHAFGRLEPVVQSGEAHR